MIAAIRSWGSALDEAEFKQLYKSRLFAHIQWRRLTNQTMLELHKEAILPLELENKAMVEILGRTEALPNEDSKVR